MFLQCQYRSLSGAPVPLYSVLGNHLLPPVRKISFLSMVIPGSNAAAWVMTDIKIKTGRQAGLLHMDILPYEPVVLYVCLQYN